VPTAPFVVFNVPDDAPATTEQMGSKRKFWFSRESEMWLFKATRPGQGEHWAEVLAEGLAELLGLPHAHYELARWRDENGVVNSGVVTRRFVAAGFYLVHGNELLAERDPNYPLEGARYIRTKEHTIDAVRGAIGAGAVALPADWASPGGIDDPVDVFGGYLLLDAWIGNTDRHHENWGIVVNLAKGQQFLAPTFDHASSLGAHLHDGERLRRLESPDPGFQVEGYVRRADARSALFLNAGDARPLPLLEAFQVWSERAQCGPWLDRLGAIRDAEVKELIDLVPQEEMSGPAKAFACAILAVNKSRILGTR
jgi:hypothetical protein